MTDPAPEARVEYLLAQAGWVTNLVRSMVRDADLAADVAQETMLLAIAKTPRAHEAGRLRSWLATVAQRLARRQLRRDAARRRREAEVAPSETFDPARIEERLQLQHQLATEVLELDEMHRTPVILCYQDGLSAKDIAIRLGISHAAARQRITRGVSKLRQRLEQRHGNGRSGWVAVFSPLLQGPVAPPPATLRRPWLWSLAVPTLAAVAWYAWPATGSPIAARQELATSTPTSDHGAVPPSPVMRAETGPEPAPAAGTDVAAVDRDRDLHGRIVDAQGQPIAGAIVEAMRVDDGAYRIERTSRLPPLAQTHSDALGEFRLRLERDANIDLHVRADHHGFELLPDRRAGERTEVRLAPAARLDGRVLRAGDGQPLAGLPVRFVRLWFADGTSRELGRTTTGSAGEFSLTGLAPGRVAIEVSAPGDACAPTVVSIDAGSSVRTTIEVGASRLLRGRVLDELSHQPIADATVVGSRAQPTTGGTRHREPRPVAVARSWATPTAVATDASGHFEVLVPDGFAPGQLHVSAAGHASVCVPLRTGTEPELTVALRSGWSLAGRVLGKDGQPLPGVRVIAQGSMARSGLEHGDRHDVDSDGDGHFVIHDLREELRYHVVIRHPPFAPRIVDVERAGHGETVPVGDLRLEPPAVLRGTTTGLDGNPKADVHITVESLAGDQLDRVRSDDLGRFAAAGLPPGRVRLRVGHAIEELELAAGEVHEGIQLALAQDSVFGLVTDMLGTPIHNALVLLVDDHGTARPRQFVSGEDGRFLFDGVSPGRYSLRAAPNSIFLPGGDRMVHQVRLDTIEPSPIELRVVLPPAVATRGSVTDVDGKPIASTLVFARHRNGELATYESTARDGTFMLRLPPDTVVDLAVGEDAPRQILVHDVRAGSNGVNVVRVRPPR